VAGGGCGENVPIGAAASTMLGEEGVMYIVSWALFGLIVGLIAKLLMRRRPTSFVLTSLLGVGGALLGGFLGRVLGIYPSYRSTGGFLASIVGAMIILAIHGAITRPKRPI
jgi:uncharacterized membrane protein YeaQ/YmgE (transglycosylase-associated protein family)